MRPILLAGVALLSALSPASAQMIAGLVLDKTSRAPVRRMTVHLVVDSGSKWTPLASTTTDSSGIFYLQAPRFGAYRLVFEVSNVSLHSVPLVVNDSDVQKEFLIDAQTDRTYFEFQVDKQVAMMPNQQAPKYPPSLRKENIEGEVLVQFIVDTTGYAEMSTFKVIRSPNPEFTESVREAVRWMRFYPAEVGGRKVKQMAHVPFVFSLNR